MKRFRLACFFLTPAACLLSCAVSQNNAGHGGTEIAAPETAGAPGTVNVSGTAEAEILLDGMSDSEILAQTFMFGWQGAQPSPLILEWVRTRRIGGVKVFGWNAQNLETLAGTVAALQEAAIASPLGIPLLVATDQEGGIVRHVKGSTSDTPGNMAIGASAYPEDAYRSGFYIGRELSLLGINMNFAPVVDLATRRDSQLIGPRSFGADPVNAGILGAAFMKGQAAAGIISTAKHFPGHGDTSLDSHGTLPRIAAGENTLWERELVPYRIMVKEGLPAIMSGHLAFPDTPAGERPASLSSWFLNDTLRTRMGYRGLVITDDLLMYGAVQAGGNLANTAKEALLAGNDMILVSTTPELYSLFWTSLLESMRNETEFKRRVREAAGRILVLKLGYLENTTLVPDTQKLKELPDPEGAAFFRDLAARSVTLINGESSLPLTPEAAGRVLLAGQYAAFFSAGLKAYPGSAIYSFEDSGGAAEFRRMASNADTIIFCLADDEGQRLLEAAKNPGKRVIVISALNPVYVDGISRVDAALAVYSYSADSFNAAFSALLGRFVPAGRLP
ncbi:MAG: glycoside hydrolase family 3 protein [Treponema sp.]|nr:glycoside hydrolase family 3 protein [Treponema sp.]